MVLGFRVGLGLWVGVRLLTVGLFGFMVIDELLLVLFDSLELWVCWVGLGCRLFVSVLLVGI